LMNSLRQKLGFLRDQPGNDRLRRLCSRTAGEGQKPLNRVPSDWAQLPKLSA
jgi:hypothetical protein